jgi:hypothetical protein
MTFKFLGRLLVALAMALPGLAGRSQAAETVIYRFTGGADGALPNFHLLIKYFPSSKSYALFGTTSAGGVRCAKEAPPGCGTVFALGVNGIPKLILLNTLYTFKGGADGQEPLSGMQLNADGTTLFGAATVTTNPASTVLFKLEPGQSTTGYVKTVVDQVTDLPAPFPPYGIPSFFQLYLEPTTGVFFGVRRYSGLNKCAPAPACGEIVMVK